MKQRIWLIAALILSACTAQKRVIYLQDVASGEQIRIAQQTQIRIKPFDRLTVVVNSRDPELAAPFNTSTSYNSLSGVPLSSSTASNNSLQTLTVDEHGDLDMPVIGKVGGLGLTRSELAAVIADRIRRGGYISDPTVNIQFADMKVSVLGEVVRPGQYTISTDRISLLDALAMAGDMTIYGQRKEVMVVREAEGVRTTTLLDLTSQEIYDSSYFYLQQNDVVYVKPNKYRAQTAEIDQNRNFYTNTVISLIATGLSIATLIITLNHR